MKKTLGYRLRYAIVFTFLLWRNSLRETWIWLTIFICSGFFWAWCGGRAITSSTTVGYDSPWRFWQWMMLVSFMPMLLSMVMAYVGDVWPGVHKWEPWWFRRVITDLKLTLRTGVVRKKKSFLHFLCRWFHWHDHRPDNYGVWKATGYNFVCIRCGNQRKRCPI